MVERVCFGRREEVEQATWLLGVGRLQLTDNVKRNQYYGLKANFDWVICTKDQDCKGLYGKKTAGTQHNVVQ